MFAIQRFSTHTALRLPRPGALVRALNRPAARPDPAIRAVAGEYRLRLDGPPRPLTAAKPGAGQHELWLLETPQGRKVLKRYKAFLKEGQIAFEHAILLHLAGQGFPTTRLVSHPGGGTYTQMDGRYYAVLDYLEGHFRFDNYIFIPAQSSWYEGELGRALARLHAALRGFAPGGHSDYGFQPAGERADSLAWYLETLRQNREAAAQQSGDAKPSGDIKLSDDARPSGDTKLSGDTKPSGDARSSDDARPSGLTTPLEDAQPPGGPLPPGTARLADPANRLLLPLAGRIQERLVELDERLGEANLPRQVIHGDYGPYNLLVRPGGGLAVLDFELARLDWRLVDLVSALSTTTTARRPSAYLATMRPILAGYQSVAALPPDELRLLPLVWQYLILRRVILCWKWRLKNGDKKWLDEIRRRLARLAWVEQHAGELI